MFQIIRYKDVFFYLVKKFDNELLLQEYKCFNIDDVLEVKQLIDNSFLIEKKNVFIKNQKNKEIQLCLGLF